MAAKVNKKLLLILMAFLVAVSATIIVLAVIVNMRGPERYRELGDKERAAGNWRAAAEMYERAVARDQSSIEYIDLWMDALLHVVPRDRTEAEVNYRWIRLLHKSKAEIEPSNVSYHLALLEFFERGARAFSSPEMYKQLSTYATQMLDHVSPEDEQAIQAYRARALGQAGQPDIAGMTSEERANLKSDLDIALAELTDDASLLDALVSWAVGEATVTRRLEQTQAAREVLTDARAHVDRFVESHPDDGHGRLVQVRLNRVLQAMPEIGVSVDPVAATAALNRLEEICLTGTVSAETASGAAIEIAGADRVAGLERGDAILVRAMEAFPERARLMAHHADMLERMGLLDEAYAAFEDVIEHPDLPTGEQSINLFRMRVIAVQKQFDIRVSQWAAVDASDAEAVGQAVADAQAARERCQTYLPENDSYRVYMEAHMARINGRYDKAASLFTRYVGMTGGRDMEAAMLAARALRDSGQVSAAYSQYEEIANQTQGRYTPAVRELIVMDVERREYDSAERRLSRLLSLDPADGWAVTMQSRLRAIRGEMPVDGAGGSDAVSAALLEAQTAMRASGNPADGIVILEAAVEANPGEMRLVITLARLLSQDGQRERALEVVRAGLAEDEGNETLAFMEAELAESDVREVIDRIVNANQKMRPVDRLLRRSSLYRQYGHVEDADRLFDEATELEPDHPVIAEARFVTLLTEAKEAEANGDAEVAASLLVQAEQLATRARDLNLDQAEGLTYTGRLELSRGNSAAAISALRQATTIKAYDGALWRYLAMAYQAEGRYTSALDAFEQSIKQRDDDVVTLKEYARLQVEVSDYDGALATIGRAYQLASSDDTVRDMYFDLEGRYGNRSRVIQLRTGDYEVPPASWSDGEQIANAIALVDLLTLPNMSSDDETQNFVKAQAILDSLDPESESWELRVLDAQGGLLIRKGEIDEAEQVYTEFLSRSDLSSGQRVQASLSLSRILIGRQEADEALQVLQEARAFQDEVRCEADRALGAYFMRQGDSSAALEHYLVALAGDPTDRTLSLQVIDLYLALARGDEETSDAFVAQGRAQLQQHLDRFDASVETLLLEATIEGQAGNAESAGRLFDEAQKKYPDDWRTYRQRARFLLNQYRAQPSSVLVSQIRDDVSRATELNRDDVTSLLIRAELALALVNPTTGESTVDHDDLRATYRQVLAVDPGRDEIRQRLIDLHDLWYRNYSAAASVAQDGIDADAGNPIWHYMLGRMKRKRGDKLESYWPDLERSLALGPTPQRLLTLVDALVSSDPPASMRQSAVGPWRRRNYQAVIQLVEQYPELAGTSALVMILHARAVTEVQGWSAGQPLYGEAREVALRISRWQNRALVIERWFYHVSRAVRPLEFVAAVEGLCGSQLTVMEAINLAQMLCGTDPEWIGQESAADQDALRREGLNQLAGVRDLLVSQGRDAQTMDEMREEWQALVVTCGNLMGSVYFQEEDWENAVAAWKWVLSARPDDVQSNNNLAFTLADKLDRATEALPYSSEAFRASSENPSVADTYGYILMLTGRHDEAEQILRDACQVSESASLRLHLGMVLIKKGLGSEAREELDKARELAEKQNQAGILEQIPSLLEEIGRAAGSDGG
ncbi:MAG: hypothetical protein D8M59_12005 [Planctomycetes bacterium]|nr:hypothetical protein [Planctomycetota bacterium]